MPSKSKVLMKDILGQKFVVQKDTETGKIRQVTTPANFRVGIEPCDAALTVTGPIFSLCSGTTSVIDGNLFVSGTVNVEGSVAAASGSTAVNPIYHGFASGSLEWTSTSWADVTDVANIEDIISGGISRTSGEAKFSFVSAGYYRIDARFNSLGVDAYLGFRITSSAGTTLVQHTDYINQLQQHDSHLVGIFEVTGANDWVSLQYAQKSGTIRSWSPFGQIDGENMRSVNLSFWGVRLT